MAAVNSWLKCSQRLPISIHVRGVYISFDVFRLHVSTLLQHSSRWESATFTLEGLEKGCLFAFDTVNRHAFPILRDFNLAGGTGRVSSKLTRALRAAPNLRTVHLGHNILNRSWSLQWSNITDLSLEIWLEKITHQHDFDLDWLISVWGACTSLTMFELAFSKRFLSAWGINPDELELGRSATVDSLKHLRLAMDLDMMSIIVVFLDCPNLLSLSLNMQGSPFDEDHWLEILDFTDDFTYSFERLEIYSAHINVSPVVQLLDRVPMLLELVLWDLRSGDFSWAKLFDDLQVRKLAELTIGRPRSSAKRVEGDYWAYGKLVEMLETKWRDGTGPPGDDEDDWEEEPDILQISTLRIFNTDLARMKRDCPEEHRRLMQLVENGMYLVTDDTDSDDESDEEPDVRDSDDSEDG